MLLKKGTNSPGKGFCKTFLEKIRKDVYSEESFSFGPIFIPLQLLLSKILTFNSCHKF